MTNLYYYSPHKFHHYLASPKFRSGSYQEEELIKHIFGSGQIGSTRWEVVPQKV